MSIPLDSKYAKSHEYVHFDEKEGVGMIGITDYAQKELGDVVFVELPQVGSELDAADELGSIESVKAVSELYAPVSGTVVEVNTALKEKPEAVNSDPHESWMIVLKLSDAAESGTLLDVTQYSDLVK